MNKQYDETFVDESELFHLKNGQYVVSEHHSKILTELTKMKPEISMKWDEQSVSDMFTELYEDKVCYCNEENTWYAYYGDVWKKDYNGIQTREYLKQFCRLLLLYAGEINDEDISAGYLKFTTKLQDVRSRDRIIKDACSNVQVSVEIFDSDIYLINCKNGTYDLREKKFRPHRASDMLTKITNCNYVQAFEVVRLPRWDKFIDEITCGDKKLANYIQRVLGSTLVGRNIDECMFFAYGKTTRNGKGTLFNTINILLGDYATTTDISLICGRSTPDPNKANPALAALKGVRALFMSETDHRAVLNVTTAKSYTGNDPLMARPLYGQPFRLIPQFTPIIQCNYLPKVDDKTFFTSDRCKVIPFNAHFDVNNRDTTLKEQFIEEDAKAYIFNWLIKGYVMYSKNKLNDEPECVKNAVKAYEKANDLVALFVEENYVLDLENKIERAKVYNDFRQWCRANDVESKLPAHDFYNEISLKEGIKETITMGTRYIKGIKKKTSNAETSGVIGLK